MPGDAKAMMPPANLRVIYAPCVEDSTATFASPVLVSPTNGSRGPRRLCRCPVRSHRPRGRKATPSTSRRLLDTYYQGRYDEAVAKAAAIPDLGPFRLRFVQDSPVWVNADPARIEARSAAAAAFLLEVTAARLESDWGRFSDLIEWTCVQLRTTGDADGIRARMARGVARARRARARASVAARPDIRGCRIRSRRAERRLQAERAPAGHASDARDRAFP